MSLFQQLNLEASKHGLRFIVIGGHAVIAHGFQRGTEDADILVNKENRVLWTGIVESLGYKLSRDGGTFLQFVSQDPSQWDLDLMLAPADTFEQLVEVARPTELEQAAVIIPSLEHLLALKIHAMKHGQGLRVLKDTTDVAQLLLVNRMDPKSPRILALFEKHGDPKSYERIIQLLA